MTPALFPPAEGAHHTWPTANFTNPETRNWAAPAIVIALFLVTFFVFCARIWARFRITHTSGVDDWLIIASMPTLLGLTIATGLALRKYGFHLHIYDQTPLTDITIRQITLAIEIIYISSTTLTKISIFTFYRRITTSVINRKFIIAVWASIAFIAVYGVSSILALVFTCSPVEAYWYRFTASWLKSHKYTCHDEFLALIIIISTSTMQYLIACLLPMLVVAKLRLPMRQKIGLSAVFLIGLGTCGLGALRIHYAHRVYYYTKLHPSPTYDISWEALISWVATAAEANLAVVWACTPALKVYFPRWLNDSAPEVRTFGWYNERRGRPRRIVGLSTDASDMSSQAVELTVQKGEIARLETVNTLRSTS